MLKNIILSIIFLSNFTQASPLQKETLKEYLAVTDVYGQMKASVPLMVAPFGDMILKGQEKKAMESGLNQKQVEAGLSVMKKHVEAVLSSTASRFPEMISLIEIEDIYYPVVKDLYSEEDIKGLSAFYSSELGKKSLRLGQIVQTKTFGPIQKLVSDRTQIIFSDEFKKRREVAISEMSKAIDGAR